MVTHVIWDLGDTLLTPPPGGQDLRPLDEYPQIRLRPGVAETLQRLSQSAMTQAVLSNTAVSESADARRLLAGLGIADYLTFIHATQSELDASKPQKPAAEVFEGVLRVLEITPQHAVMVGNSWDHDILGANGSGMHAIWLQNPEVSARRDTHSPVQVPPWILPVWDVADVPSAIRILKGVRD